MLRRKIPKNATGMTRKKTVQCVVIPIYPTRRLTWIFLSGWWTKILKMNHLMSWICEFRRGDSRSVNPECWSSISWQSPKFPVNLSKHPSCHIILPQPYLRIGKCSKVEYVTVFLKSSSVKNPWFLFWTPQKLMATSSQKIQQFLQIPVLQHLLFVLQQQFQ